MVHKLESLFYNIHVRSTRAENTTKYILFSDTFPILKVFHKKKQKKGSRNNGRAWVRDRGLDSLRFEKMIPTHTSSEKSSNGKIAN